MTEKRDHRTDNAHQWGVWPESQAEILRQSPVNVALGCAAWLS
jgi:hypothetical protein